MRIRNQTDFYFVQVGANDGIRFDSLYHLVANPRCSGLVIEPVKEYFERLEMNYRPYPKIQPVNLAIHKEHEKSVIYRVDPLKLVDLPDWADGIASLLPAHHKGLNIPQHCMVAEPVKCVHLMVLLEKHNVKRIDLLQIDVEGYDAEIVKMIDFQAIEPRIIKYEHKTITPQEKRETEVLLKNRGYSLFFEGQDTIALLRS